MTAREKENEEKREYWLSHIENWGKSGLSQAEYCREQDLIYSRFIYWKALWKKAPKAPAFVPVPVGLPEVPVFSGSSNRMNSSLRLTIRDHYKLEIGDNFRSETLARLLHLLEQR